MLNNVVLIGRTTRDAELRYTPNNKAVATVTLAVNRTQKNEDGSYKADFINLVLWGQTAENFSNWIKKGGLVSVVGRIETRNYDNQQTGQKVYVTEVVVHNFTNLSPRNSNGDAQQAGQFQQQNQAPANNFAQGQATPNFQGQDVNPFGQTNPLDISDDDLPF